MLLASMMVAAATQARPAALSVHMQTSFLSADSLGACVQQAAAAPAPAAITIANVNAQVTNCTAFYPYSLQAQTGAPARR